MAKSARASGVKKNKQNLKKKVFAPVETARNERLSAKLLELANQPKPLRAEMEVEGDGMSQSQDTRNDHVTDSFISAEAKDDAGSDAREDKATEGVSPSMSISIPISLLYNHTGSLPTPPATPISEATGTVPFLDILAQKALAKEMLFYHFLGTSNDIIGFDENGDLELSFAGPR